MKSFWTIVALIVIVGSVGFLVSYYAKQPAPGQAVAHRAPVACEACGKAYITMISDMPAECFYCGEQAVWRALQCAECGAIFPVTKDTSHGASSSLVCPKCGKSSFKEVSSDGLEEH